jgi:hypothetical protein
MERQRREADNGLIEHLVLAERAFARVRSFCFQITDKRGSANGANGPRMKRAAIREYSRRHAWRNSRTFLGF